MVRASPERFRRRPAVGHDLPRSKELSVAEDARAAARRIVEEVLAARAEQDARRDTGTNGSHPDRVRTAGAASGTDGLDPRVADARPRSIPDQLLDERPSRQVARRIVEEVLAAHARADRDLDLPAPAAEAVGPPPAGRAVPLQPVPGRDAVRTGPPDVGVEATTGPAEDAAAIARRIVASVLAESEARTPATSTEVPVDGPPPLPADRSEPHEDAPAAEDAVALPVADEAPDTAVAEDTVALPVADEAPDTAVAEDTVALPVADETPGAAVAADTVALPVTDEASEDANADDTAELPTIDLTEDPDETISLAVESDPARPEDDDPGPPPFRRSQGVAVAERTREPVTRTDDVTPRTAEAVPTPVGPVVQAPLDPAPQAPVAPPAPERRNGSFAATIAPAPARTEPAARARDRAARAPLAQVPTAPKPRRVRWVLATILGAICIAVLLPLAVGAMQDLVALS
jgi:hypothetical protein